MDVKNKDSPYKIQLIEMLNTEEKDCILLQNVNYLLNL